MKTKSTLANEFDTLTFETLENEEMKNVEGGAELVVRIIDGKLVAIIR